MFAGEGNKAGGGIKVLERKPITINSKTVEGRKKNLEEILRRHQEITRAQINVVYLQRDRTSAKIDGILLSQILTRPYLSFVPLMIKEQGYTNPLKYLFANYFVHLEAADVLKRDSELTFNEVLHEATLYFDAHKSVSESQIGVLCLSSTEKPEKFKLPQYALKIGNEEVVVPKGESSSFGGST